MRRAAPTMPPCSTWCEGAANFIAGQTAKTGDMKVATPAVTMGIRGTAVILDISATDGRVSVSVIDQRDGQIYRVEIFDSSGVSDRDRAQQWRTMDADPDRIAAGAGAADRQDRAADRARIRGAAGNTRGLPRARSNISRRRCRSTPNVDPAYREAGPVVRHEVPDHLSAAADSRSKCMCSRSGTSAATSAPATATSPRPPAPTPNCRRSTSARSSPRRPRSARPSISTRTAKSSPALRCPARFPARPLSATILIAPSSIPAVHAARRFGDPQPLFDFGPDGPAPSIRSCSIPPRSMRSR